MNFPPISFTPCNSVKLLRAALLPHKVSSKVSLLTIVTGALLPYHVPCKASTYPLPLWLLRCSPVLFSRSEKLDYFCTFYRQSLARHATKGDGDGRLVHVGHCLWMYQFNPTTDHLNERMYICQQLGLLVMFLSHMGWSTIWKAYPLDWLLHGCRLGSRQLRPIGWQYPHPHGDLLLEFFGIWFKTANFASVNLTVSFVGDETWNSWLINHKAFW